MNSNENVDFNNKQEDCGRIGRLYLTNIIRDNLLNKRDLRTIRKWCNDNFVQIIKDRTGEFVIQQEFDLAYNSPIVKKLMGQYGPIWHEYYSYYLKNEVHKIVAINPNETNRARYTPKGSIALKHLK